MKNPTEGKFCDVDKDTGQSCPTGTYKALVGCTTDPTTHKITCPKDGAPDYGIYCHCVPTGKTCAVDIVTAVDNASKVYCCNIDETYTLTSNGPFCCPKGQIAYVDYNWKTQCCDGTVSKATHEHLLQTCTPSNPADPKKI